MPSGRRADRRFVDAIEFESTLAGAREGAGWAWERLYTAYSPRLLGYVRSRGAYEPEDLLGEVWLQLARGIPDFEGDEPGFRSWAFMIAHNRVIDEHRRRAKRPYSPTPPAGLTAVADRSASVDSESGAIMALELDSLVASLGGLTEMQQSVILMRIVGDLSVSETARALDVSAATVKTATYRAIRALRDRFDDGATHSAPPTVTET
jgi:RNA polymerase sigma-70 factor, ECF subfamily